MFLLAVLHIAIDIHIALSSFLMEHWSIETIATRLDTFNAVADTFGAAKFAIYVTQLLIGDGVMIYRAYVVWDRSFKVIVLPCVFLAGELILGYFISLAGPYAPKSWAMNTRALVNAFFLLSVVTNLLSSGLIMARVLSFTSRTEKFKRFSQDSQDGRFKSVTRRVVESILQSAAIYSIASISLAVTSFANYTVAFPACHSVFPSVIGMVFLLIVMRISSSANATSRHGSMLSQTGGSTLSLSSAPSGEEKPGFDAERDGHGRSPSEQKDRWRLSSPIAIHVSVSRTSDYEEVATLSPSSPPVNGAARPEC
ncbi:hypothetical protein BD311DRAFT_648225 [Dichomitus squalens]|uniref:THH1/TOM1/TOM3 domain-containing protein n=1 Tax=Dichomitus squalens TaxID=114155 RepID=A0A4Q9N591_9APHY|nr:hypothetical protein BD311DRAFT_648225 [Dichomitus squalens]